MSLKNYYEEYGKTMPKEKKCPLSSEKRIEKILPFFEEPILDIGCSKGYDARYFYNKGFKKILGCDISEEALKMAKQRNLDVIILDAAKGGLSAFEDNKFDFVVMSELIEHIVRSEDILKEAARIAKKGVLVSTPNVAYIRSRAALLFGRFPKQWAVAPWEHLRYWSAIDFVEIIKSIGLNLKELKAANGKKILRDLWPNFFALQICYFITK